MNFLANLTLSDWGAGRKVNKKSESSLYKIRFWDLDNKSKMKLRRILDKMNRLSQISTKTETLQVLTYLDNTDFTL